MNTTAKFSTLSEETQQEVIRLLHNLESIGQARPDEFDHIVNYYYDQENALPTGWFCWWE